MASIVPSIRDPPTRTQSEGDTIDNLSAINLNAQRRPTVPRVTSFTFGQKKLFGGRNTKKQWLFAAKKAKGLRDPWEGLGMENLPEEVVTRHMYNSRTKKWKIDEVVVKMQSERFANGAMRECFRMKKLSKFSQHPDWKNASNYVSKRYMKEVSKDTYFEDVKLQMDSKLWGEEYNKLDVVPKKVDFFQTYIIEFKGREGSPLYGVEHFIEGGYVKYNSNSGFVSDVNRLTPQTFSHFTFEKSDHQLILVDIQGVGDLYTDPQMHTVDQKEYGEANLGIRGMALYFSSHICSPLCNALGLTQFDLSEKEVDNLLSKRWDFSSSTTKVTSLPSHSKEIAPVKHVSKKKDDKETVGQAFRRLSASINVESLKNSRRPSNSLLSAMGGIPESPLPLDSPVVLSVPPLLGETPPMSGDESDVKNNGGIIIKVPLLEQEQDLHPSESYDSGDEQYLESCFIGTNENLDTCPNDVEPTDEDCMEEGNKDEEDVSSKPGLEESKGDQFVLQVPEVLHSSSVEKERTRLKEEGGAGPGVNETDALKILGMIHIDLAKLHESGRFSNEKTPIDSDAIKFHLDKAASCGDIVALYTLAQIYLQQPHEDFKDISVESSLEHERVGMDYLIGAAERGLRPAMFEAARAFDTGIGLGASTDPDKMRTQNWSEAATWYHKVLQPEADTANISTDSMVQVNPDYLLLARLAELYRSGGNGLEKDPQKSGDLYTEAAEAAMNAMKGKLSNKYYMLAEEAWGEMEEED